MNRTARNSMFFVFAIAVLTFGAGSVLAQTADGLTPAIEQDCSELSGAAFGLCNAYCEAMDCELMDDDDNSTWPNASDKACLKVKDNFIKITGIGAFPCECSLDPGRVGCSCVDDAGCNSGVCNTASNTCIEDPSDPEEPSGGDES